MITNAHVMILEEINELLSRMPDTTELKEIAGKMLKEYEEKEEQDA